MKQILITIDTEVGELGRNHPQAFETFVEGKIGGQEYGYRKIIDTLDRHKAVGEFFVDVYPTRQFGENAFADLCAGITKAGHRVQLHTHPNSAYDPKRRYLSDYSADEQLEVVREGARRIKKWTGVAPIAHRAGGYGVNEDSLAALEKSGIAYDSSFHFGNEHCRLPLVTKNIPYRIGSVWQIPVTGYQQNASYTIAGIPLQRRRRFQKLDFRYGSSAAEIVEAIRQAPDNSTQVLFLHSFNFLDLSYNLKKQEYTGIKPFPELLEQFDTLLSELSEQADCRFTGFAELDLDSLPADYLATVETRRSLVSHVSEITREKLFHTVTT